MFQKISLLIALVVFFPWSAIQAAQTPKEKIVFKIAADIWCPYTCEEGDRPGYFIEIARLALQEKGVDVQYHVLNWARAVKDAGAGEYDAIAGASTADAPTFVYPSIPQYSLSFELFALKDRPWKFTGSFSGKKIGVINGYNYDDETNALIAAKRPEFVVVSGERGLNSLIPMLNLQRIDAVLETKGVFYSGVDNLKLPHDKYTSIGSTSKKPIDHYIAISPKYKHGKEIAKWLTEGQKKLEAKGTLKALRQKYNL